MEYCITVLLREYLPGPRLQRVLPTRTIWGDAWRQGEEGTYAWVGDLLVREIPALPFLIPHLPPTMRQFEWKFLHIFGTGLHAYEKLVNDGERFDAARSAEYSLTSLLVELLKGESKWAVFFQKDCDTVSYTGFQTIPELLESAVKAYHYGTGAREQDGFCSCSTT